MSRQLLADWRSLRHSKMRVSRLRKFQTTRALSLPLQCKYVCRVIVFAVDKYRKSLQSKDAAIPQSSLNASWTDKIVFRLSEVIGSLMKQELGNKLHPANIKSKLQPLLLQELVTVSELPLNSDGGKKHVAFVAQFSSDALFSTSKRAHQLCLQIQIKKGSLGKSRNFSPYKFLACTKFKTREELRGEKCSWI